MVKNGLLTLWRHYHVMTPLEQVLISDYFLARKIRLGPVLAQSPTLLWLDAGVQVTVLADCRAVTADDCV